MFDRLSGATRLFPIIGDPIKYVESPMRLTRTFEQRDYNGICIPMRVPAGDLDAVMAGLTAARNVDGILVTMPHKFTAFAHCATSSERAKMLGVVSVIRRNPDGTWHGDMLDGLAFVKAQKDHGAQPQGARALLVGAGGPTPSGKMQCTAYRSAAHRSKVSPGCGPCSTRVPSSMEK
jgi:shikimate 5-dehydrogenase